MLTRRELIFGAAGVAVAALAPTDADPQAAGQGSVSFLMPAGATDCHAHVFCDSKAFPMAPGRTYTPEAAPVNEYITLARRIGIERTVFVQPTVYGTDNTCVLAAIREVGSHARGVAVIDDKTPDAEIDEMERSGIRGLRINLETAGQSDPALARQRFLGAAMRIGSRRLHIQMFTRPSVIAGIRDAIEASPVTVVFDHFGGAQAAGGVQQPGFDALVALVQSGKAYVKLSAPYRGSTQAPAYTDMAPLANALIAANPQRILWGSDWPHPNTSSDAVNPDSGLSPRLPVDDVAVLNQLQVWLPTIPQRRVVLVENPARLYGW
jgi:predicted TIM-barrel fold metal-dependent hydrolase